MNEKFKIVLLYIIVGFLFTATLFFTGTTIYFKHQCTVFNNRLEQCMGELRYCREQYERADEIQRSIECTVRDAQSTVERQRNSLCISVTSIAELRRSLEEIQQYCTDLENYIYSINGELGRNDNSTNNNSDK